jgi:thioredoxin 1
MMIESAGEAGGKMAINQVRAGEFEQEVLQQEGWVLVDFYADWCGPCRVLTPRLERFAEEHAGKVRLVKLDVDRDEELAERYEVRTIPTVIAFRNGEEVSRVINPRTASALDDLIRE